MSVNLIPEVAKLLGVQLDEEFLIDGYDTRYKITDNGLLFLQDDEWYQSLLLVDVLKGKSSIIKL